MKTIASALVLAAGLACGALAHAATATFDDLPSLPAADAATGIFSANNSSLGYAGVTWVDTVTPGPLFGVPHSGHYFVTNGSASNDQLLVTTPLLLTGAWFGRNEYYGFGGGADQITIHAMRGASVLGSVVFNLPELRASGPAAHPGEPEVLEFVDTASFATLTGITGYRVDRHEIGTLAGSWVADDFTFTAAAPVPEPGIWAMLLVGLGLVAETRRRAKQG
jgi:hypothetical protein